jgi:hypothetical protein
MSRSEPDRETFFVGNPATGCDYYSHHPGKEGHHQHFDAFDDASQHLQSEGYERYNMWTTDASNDDAARQAAEKVLEKPYGKDGKICTDLAAEVLDAAGGHFTGYGHPNSFHRQNIPHANESAPLAR